MENQTHSSNRTDEGERIMKFIEEEEVKDKQGYLASFEDLYKEILQAMVKLDAKIKECFEVFDGKEYSPLRDSGGPPVLPALLQFFRRSSISSGPPALLRRYAPQRSAAEQLLQRRRRDLLIFSTELFSYTAPPATPT
ncbi:hypothetical protein LXL04_009336 [Taraxacum kok-saghyz]